MRLIVSDMHFGRGPAEEDEAAEDDLLACLRHHRPDLDELVLLGDVFDHYIEYRHLVPKGAPRLMGLLAEWTREGLPVRYLVGNHDPWHRDYFTDELGVTVHAEPRTVEMEGRRVYLAHGDGLAASNWIYNHLKPLLRHPLLVRLYRSILPADWGVRLARRWSRRHHRPAIRPEIAEDLADRARSRLAGSNEDVVVFAHSHRAEHRHGPEGCYVNSGCWHLDRSFLTLEEDGVRLWRWNGAEPSLVEQCALAPRSGD